MLIWRQVTVYGGKICVTDDPAVARRQKHIGPVIGYVGKSLGNLEDWSGIFYLIMDLEALTQPYLEMVWCRYHGLPYVLIRREDFWIREMKPEDALGLCVLCREAGEDAPNIWEETWNDPQEAKIRLRDYACHVYPVRGFGMYVLEKEGELLGTAGFDMEEIMGESRVVMGYYVRKRDRRRGIGKAACELLLKWAREEWGIREVFLKIKKENRVSAAFAQKMGFVPWIPDDSHAFPLVPFQHGLDAGTGIGAQELFLFFVKLLD